ncbi:MAG: bacteriohemerythrin [Planctomycetaceae bacterium]|nr:bacteriohemerythrin [Planctomycetaceae bacterium]
MVFFEWTDELSVGVEQMDIQHKKLITLINNFHKAIDMGEDKSAVQKAIDGLVDYVKVHFIDEEALMQEYNFPQLDIHRRMHEHLARDVNEYAEKLQAGQKIMGIEMAFFLKGWLENHIGETDKNYGLYIAEQKNIEVIKK